MKRFIMNGLLIGAAAVMLVGCSCYGKMSKNIDNVRSTSNPEMLMLQGNTVTADVRMDFPPKYFHKKAVLRVTPVLVYAGGEITGQAKYLQGEGVRDNYTVIPKNTGGYYVQNVTLPYDERAKLSTLELRVDARCEKGVEYESIASVPVARGISTVQNTVDWTSNMSIMPDNFQRVTRISQDADLVYQINSAQVRNVALNTDQIRMFEDFVKENSDRERVTLGNVSARGYASPDGPTKFNDELSQKRSESAKQAVGNQLGNVPVGIDAAPYGEDWEGFRKLVQESNIPDKDLILQVLDMYNSPVQRDQQIRNMSEVYNVLKTDILPRLRRTQLSAVADVAGKTNEEIILATRTNINSLNVEEMLYAATLVPEKEMQAAIYKAAADRYNDPRAWNNYAVTTAQMGLKDEAQIALNRAVSLSSAPEISNNLGAMALAEGRFDEARRYLSPLNSTDAAANKGLLAMAEGDFTQATRTLTGYNLAVAEFCSGNISGAKNALAGLDSADADYLRAIIAMREGNTRLALSNLSTAYAKNPSLRRRALQDAEFTTLMGTPEFRSL